MASPPFDTPPFDTGFDPAAWAGSPVARSATAGRVVLVPRAHRLRGAAEACIRAVYAEVHGAGRLEFPALLAVLTDGEDRPLCAAGLRTATDGFFSEAYLDRPIEQELAARFAKPAERRAVFEITTLASREVRVSRAFLHQLAALGRSAGFGWCFFTAGTRLRRLLGHMAVPLVALAPADPRRLADPGRWGRYYAQAPLVCAVDGAWLAEETGETRDA